MAFWHAIIKAGESKTAELIESDLVLTLGNVALNNGAEGKAAKLWATVEEEDGPQKVLLATLRTPSAEQAVLDITFPSDVTLSVEGAGEIHVAGIIAPGGDDDDDDAAYGGFGSDEEIGSDEEGLGALGGSGSEGEDDDEGSDELGQDPRVQELGSDDSGSDAVPAGKAAKLLARAAPEQAASGKKQKVEIPISTGKKPAAAAPAKKAAAKPAAPAAEGGVAGLKCSECGKAFNAPAGLDQHMKAKHGAGGDAKPAAAGTPKAAAAAAAAPKPATPKGEGKAKPAGAAAAGTPKKAATPKGK